MVTVSVAGVSTCSIEELTGFIPWDCGASFLASLNEGGASYDLSDMCPLTPARPEFPTFNGDFFAI